MKCPSLDGVKGGGISDSARAAYAAAAAQGVASWLASCSVTSVRASPCHDMDLFSGLEFVSLSETTDAAAIDVLIQNN